MAVGADIRSAPLSRARQARPAAYDHAQLAALMVDHHGDSLSAEELVLLTVRQAILEGVLAPGTRLRQEDLANVFNVTRIPVREALRALQHQGLVSSEPRKGFAVTTLDAEQIDEIYELRTVLEAEAVRLAVPLLTETDIEELAALLIEMREARRPEEELRTRELFYNRFYAVSGRARLVALIASLRQEVSRSLRWKQVQHSPHYHEAFFLAMKAGDAELAVSELTAHYRKVSSLLQRFARQAPGSS